MTVMPAFSYRSLLVIAAFAACLFLFGSSCKRSGKVAAVAEQQVADTIADELTRLNKQVDAEPSAIRPYMERARYFAGKGQENEALADISRALTLDENNPDVYAALSDVYMYSGKMQRALDALKKAKELAPGAGVYDVKMARLYLTMSDYKQTFNALREGLRKDPDNAEAFFISGLANEEMGDTLKAIDSYQMAVAKDQNHYDALKQLGIIMAERKNKLAVDYLRNAARVKPGSPDPLYVLGMYYQENGEPDKALSVYGEILIIDENYKLAHYNKGYVHLVYKEEYAEAVSAFSRAIEIDNEYTDAYYNRGFAYELMGDLAGARKDYERVLRMKVNDDKAVEGLNRLDALKQ
jgi:tetratricopeptide (TPR) repeat protein